MGAEGFWFDFVSPQSFLKFRELDRADAKPSLRPVGLRALFEALQTSGPPLSPARPDAKARYLARELARNAAAVGVTLTEPTGHPVDTTLALRVALTAGRDVDLRSSDWAVTRALFEAYWSGARIDHPEVIVRELARRGFDGAALVGAAASERSFTALTQNLKEAIEAGVFDVPTVIDEGELSVGFSPAALTITASPALDFYFDYASPFAYLGTTQLQRLVDLGFSVTLKPIVLGGLFKALGTSNVPLFEMSQAKRDHQLRHLMRSAAAFGVPFRFATKFPMNTVKALRLTTLAPEAVKLSLVRAIFHAFWVDDRDISSDDELRAIADGVGIDVAAIWPNLERDETKHALREATDAAIAVGVFGVPTIVCNSPGEGESSNKAEPFWGQDQIELVARLLGAQTNRAAPTVE